MLTLKTTARWAYQITAGDPADLAAHLARLGYERTELKFGVGHRLRLRKAGAVCAITIFAASGNVVLLGDNDAGRAALVALNELCVEGGGR